MKNVCFFCGSSAGNNPVYHQQVELLSQQLALAGWGLVYGGASIGLMGVAADAFLQQKASVQGVIPRFLQIKEVAHAGVTQMHQVETMHERKQIMYDLSEAFVVLPGGMGTLDECFEILTWKQLKQHDKPCILWNLNGFYDHLLAHLERIQSEDFLKDLSRYLMIVETQDELLAALGKKEV